MSISSHSFKLLMDLKEFKSQTGLARSEFAQLSRTVASLETPLQKMKREVDVATIAFQKGALAPEHYRKILSNFKQEQLASIPVIGKFASGIMAINPVTAAATVGLAGLTAGFAAVGVAAKVSFDNISKQFAEIDKIAKASKTTGFDTGALVGLERAGGLTSGVDAGKVQESLGVFTRNLGLVQMGAGEAKVAIEKLGLSAAELTSKTPLEALKMVSDRFKGITSASEKAAIAQKFFGDSGAKLIPLLEQGGDALERYIQDAKDLRLDIDPESEKAVQDFNDAVADLGNAWTGFWRDAAGAVAPGLAESVKDLNAVIQDPDTQKAMDSLIGGFRALGAVAPGYLKIVIENVKVLGATLDSPGFKLLMEAGTAFGGVGGAVVGTTMDLAGAMGSLNEELLKGQELDKKLANTAINKSQADLDSAIKSNNERQAAQNQLIDEATKKSKDLVETWQEQINTVGKSSREIEIYRLQQQQAAATSTQVKIALEAQIAKLKELHGVLGQQEAMKAARDKEIAEAKKAQEEVKKAQEDAQKEQDKIKEKAAEKTRKDAEDKAKKLQDSAKAVKDSLKTEQDLFKEEVAKLGELRAKDLISREQYTAAVQKERDKLLAAMKPPDSTETETAGGRFKGRTYHSPLSGLPAGLDQFTMNAANGAERARVAEKVAQQQREAARQAQAFELQRQNELANNPLLNPAIIQSGINMGLAPAAPESPAVIASRQQKQFEQQQQSLRTQADTLSGYASDMGLTGTNRDTVIQPSRTDKENEANQVLKESRDFLRSIANKEPVKIEEIQTL